MPFFSLTRGREGRTDCCPFNGQHRVVGCNQFPARHSAPRPLVSSATALRTFTVREPPDFVERSCRAIVHLSGRFLRNGSFQTKTKQNKGCEYEYKDPCGGLLSADTLGTTTCAETARYVRQDHGLQSWSGNSQ